MCQEHMGLNRVRWLQWLDGWRTCNQVHISLKMAGYFSPSSFHLLILVLVTPGTFVPRESRVTNASVSQLTEIPQFSTAAEKPSGIPWDSQVSTDTGRA